MNDAFHPRFGRRRRGPKPIAPHTIRANCRPPRDPAGGVPSHAGGGGGIAARKPVLTRSPERLATSGDPRVDRLRTHTLAAASAPARSAIGVEPTTPAVRSVGPCGPRAVLSVGPVSSPVTQSAGLCRPRTHSRWDCVEPDRTVRRADRSTGPHPTRSGRCPSRGRSACTRSEAEKTSFLDIRCQTSLTFVSWSAISRSIGYVRGGASAG